ncbi:MAG: hypothetical protein RI936_912 [Pseudomonadota bacterium]
MDWLFYFKAALLGIIEGLTEFLPVSSTGHLIVFEDLIGFAAPNRETFIIAIQAGAILAVCWDFRARLAAVLRGLASEPVQQRLALNVVIAFLPAAIVGVLASKYIKSVLFFAVPVAIALIVGGIIILLVERAHARPGYAPRVTRMDDMHWTDALKVGLFQCFALIPGTSRSGSTIIGGLLTGLSRTAATEFSFFLAIPTVIGASVYALYKARHELSAADLPVLATGFVFSFLAAMLVVRWLLRYVAAHDYRVFGWYRIAFGLIILVTAATGLVSWNE